MELVLEEPGTGNQFELSPTPFAFVWHSSHHSGVFSEQPMRTELPWTSVVISGALLGVSDSILNVPSTASEPVFQRSPVGNPGNDVIANEPA